MVARLMIARFVGWYLSFVCCETVACDVVVVIVLLVI